MIKKTILNIVLNTLSLYLVIRFVDGVAYNESIWLLMFGGLILGLLNSFIKPLIKILAFPLVFLTGGLFLILINAGILHVTATAINLFATEGNGLVITGFITYLIAGIALGLINWLEHWLIPE